MASCGPSVAVGLTRTVELVDLGAFSPLHLQASLGLPQQPADALPQGSAGGSWLSLPSTQQLSHLLTPGDTAVHCEGSLL